MSSKLEPVLQCIVAFVVGSGLNPNMSFMCLRLSLVALSPVANVEVGLELESRSGLELRLKLGLDNASTWIWTLA